LYDEINFIGLVLKLDVIDIDLRVTIISVSKPSIKTWHFDKSPGEPIMEHPVNLVKINTVSLLSLFVPKLEQGGIKNSWNCRGTCTETAPVFPQK